MPPPPPPPPPHPATSATKPALATRRVGVAAGVFFGAFVLMRVPETTINGFNRAPYAGRAIST